MPLTWAQVKSDLDPLRFTIRKVPALLRRTKAWEDYCDAEGSLDSAIKQLTKTGRLPEAKRSGGTLATASDWDGCSLKASGKLPYNDNLH